MKTVLKSLLTITAMAVLMVNMTGAYFTSTVTAADNQINTGTLMLGLATTRSHTYSGVWGQYTAYWAAYDNAGNNATEGTLETWTNAAPGVDVAYSAEAGADTWAEGNYSWWVAVVNRGSLPQKYVAYVDNGEWTALPRAGTASCVAASNATLATADASLVSVVNVHRYDVTPTTGCNNHEECQNVRDALIANYGYTPNSGVGVHDSGPVSGIYYGTSNGAVGGSMIDLQPGEFVIYRVDANLNEAADNCYQDATYQYDLVGSAFQLGDPTPGF